MSSGAPRDTLAGRAAPTRPRGKRARRDAFHPDSIAERRSVRSSDREERVALGALSRPALHLFGAVLLLGSSCGGAQGAPLRTVGVAASASAVAAASLPAEPPPPGSPVEAAFPPVTHSRLPNGLGVRVVSRPGLPVAAVRLVVLSGLASDVGKPGVAQLTAELMKSGGAGPYVRSELIEAAERLGSSLDVLSEPDATTFSMAVEAAHLGEALDILAEVSRRPRLDPGEFKALRQREIERTQSLARSSPEWVASVVRQRQLFRLPEERHPYARMEALVEELRAVALASCRSWYTRHISPKNAFVVIAGAVDVQAVQREIERAFGGWQGPEPPRLEFAPPLPLEARRVFLVDRPGSPQSLVQVALFGPERTSSAWPVLRTANQILGGGVAGRLFLDLRERRSLAYATSSMLVELAHGPTPVVLSAGTRTEKVPAALESLLGHVTAIGGDAISEEEVTAATRYLADSFLVELATVASLASLAARLGVLGLPDEYYDRFRRQVRHVHPAEVQQLAARRFDPERVLIIVAGDAARLSQPLARFGRVVLVDPQDGFAAIR